MILFWGREGGRSGVQTKKRNMPASHASEGGPEGCGGAHSSGQHRRPAASDADQRNADNPTAGQSVSPAQTKFGSAVLASLAKPSVANTNFGQTKFGETKTKFGKTKFGQHHILGWGESSGGRLSSSGPRMGRAPKGWGPSDEAQRVGGPKFHFFPSPATIFFRSSLLVEFGWCLKRRGPEMWTLGVLGLS